MLCIILCLLGLATSHSKVPLFREFVKFSFHFYPSLTRCFKTMLLGVLKFLSILSYWSFELWSKPRVNKAKFGPPFILVNKVLLAHSHGHCFRSCLWMPQGQSWAAGAETVQRQSQKCLLSGPLRKSAKPLIYVKFASVSLNVLLPGIILLHIRAPAFAFCLALTSVSCSPILFNCNLPI